MSVVLAAAAAITFACGTWLLLQRRLSRIILGIGLLGHGANLLLLISADGRGDPPIIGGDQEAFTDPLPQALTLTAIVITFGVTAFLLALGYRSWRLTHDDEVEDDIEDRLVARHLEDDSEVRDEQDYQRAMAADLPATGEADGASPGDGPGGAGS